MRCPLCNVTMREVPRRGVKIDVCPECRGVWLDSGELEKMLDRAGEWEEEDLRRRDWDEREYERHGHRRKKRRSFLDDIFDFD